jgi:hypothetical protein
MITPAPVEPAYSLDGHMADVRRQITDLTRKIAGLTEARQQKQQHLSRLEASAAMSREIPPTRHHHECDSQ